MVTSVSPAAPNSSAAVTSFAQFSENFDSFLMLLTAQLKNQDPLSPLGATEFTTQLVQFAGVEQNIRQSRSLEDLVALQKSFQASTAVNYIGKTVEASGRQIILTDGAGALGYTLERAAATVTITIKNAAGEVVRTTSAPTSAGPHELTWDGTNNQGVKLADGLYSFEVTAKDASGNVVKATTTVSGAVTGVDMSGDQVLLRLGTMTVPLSDVTRVGS